MREQSLRTTVLDYEARQESMDELVQQLNTKRRDIERLCWKIREKAELLRRLRNELDLAKKLFQGELAMVKHEFNQRCTFLFDMAKRNEKASIKAN